jgi:ATP-dependent DNA ligase
MGLEGIVSKQLGSRYRSGRSKDWLKFKNPDAPAVKRVPVLPISASGAKRQRLKASRSVARAAIR